MRFFLVFDHYYSGIIQSQVLDVVELLEGEFEAQIKVIVFLNIRRYREERKKYLRASSKVWVLPNFGFSRWRWSFPFLALLALVYRPSHVVGRSVFAFQLGQLLKLFKLTNSVGLDARGAEYAEWKEYFFKQDEGPLPHSEIKELERSAVLQSSVRLAVSNRLVAYWQNELDIPAQLHGSTVVVPSTLSNTSSAPSAMSRKQLGIPDDAILYVFSGSRSDWHGFSQLLHTCERIKRVNSKAHFLFMTNGQIQFSENSKVKHSYAQCWVKPEQVEAHLALGDYGLLLRSPSLTNQVSSPVKYAEYLRAGLHVLVSPQIGDLSGLTVSNRCGFILDENWGKLNLKFTKRTEQERIHARLLADEYFSKRAHVKSYGALFNLQSSNPST